MDMLRHFIRKEILDHFLSTRFLVLGVLGILITWLSLYDGYAYYRSCLRDYQQAREATDARIREIIEGPHNNRRQNWKEVWYYGYMVHKPPTPLSIFVRGQEQTFPRSKFVLGPVRARRMTRSPAAVEPILGMFPPLDLGLVVQVVLGLFVLLFTYDAICGEKESGTLRAIGSFAAPRYQLLIGKILGALIATTSAFFLPLLLGIAVILLIPEIALTDSDLGRLGLILLTFGLYIGTLACAGVLFSCLAHRSITSFVLVLTFWIGSVIVLPRLSLVVSDGFRPAPSAHELQTRIWSVARQTQEDRLERSNQWRDARSKPGEEFWRTPEGREAERLFRDEDNFKTLEARNEGIKRAREDFRNRANARTDLAVSLARISPAFALADAGVKLAKTGIDRHRRFEAAYNQYMSVRDPWYLKRDTKLGLQRARPEKYGEYRWDVADIPRFTYREQAPGRDLQEALVDIALLAGWALIFFAAATVAVSRYDLR